MCIRDRKYSAEELGGATMHAEISGTVDFKEPNDHLCIARLRSLVSKWGHSPHAPFDRTAFDAENDSPHYPASELHALLDPDPAKAAVNSYDMHDVIARIVDRSEFDEYRPSYGRTLLCGYARIGGTAVGIVANQKLPQPQTSHSGEKRLEFGGVISVSYTHLDVYKRQAEGPSRLSRNFRSAVAHRSRKYFRITCVDDFYFRFKYITAAPSRGASYAFENTIPSRKQLQNQMPVSYTHLELAVDGGLAQI